MKNLIAEKKSILSPELFQYFLDRNIKRLNRNITERGLKQSDIEACHTIEDNAPTNATLRQWRDLESDNQSDSKDLHDFMNAKKEVKK